MIKLYNNETSAYIGSITEEQLQFLSDQLEEESFDDQDYYITIESIDSFREAGADTGLLTILTDAIGSNEDLEFKWIRE